MGIKKPAPPETLKADGVKVWKSIVSVYDLRPDELYALEDICGATDTLVALEKLWRDSGSPAITTGSMGQEVEHPLVGSIDKQRKTRNMLWRQLKLPDLPAVGAGSGEAATKPNQQRSAAQSKWSAAHGKGA